MIKRLLAALLVAMSTPTTALELEQNVLFFRDGGGDIARVRPLNDSASSAAFSGS